MIRLVQRKLILPRGDTGSFTIPVLPDFNTGDVAVFAIFNPLNRTIIFKKQVEIINQKITIQFSHNETVNLPAGKYLWDIKAYLNPEYADGELVNGDQIDSYYAGYKLPECQIRQTSDNYLLADDAPTSTLSSAQLDIISAALAQLRDAVKKSQENVSHYPVIINEEWHTWNTDTNQYVGTGVRVPARISDLIDDSGHYTKPANGIPANDIADGVIPDISTKADKVLNAINGNFASLDANGNLVDSGHKHSDYLTEHQDISGKQDILTFDDSPQMISDNPVKSSGLWNAFNSVNSDITFINSQISSLQNQVIGKQDLLYFDTQPKANSNHPVTSGGIKTAIDTAISTKQDTLTFDTIPTQSSNNPVTSGGIKDALSGLEWSLSERANMIDDRVDDLQNDIAGHTMDISLLESNITNLETNKQDKLTFDNTPTANSTNPVTSGGIYRAITNIKTMGIHICTSQEYNSQTGIPTIVSPDTKTFYLVPGGEGSNLYIEWVYVNNAWQQFGSATIDLSGYALLTDIPSNISFFINDVGYLTQHQDITGKQDVLTFDNVPTINSTNPVVSNGIYTAINNVIKVQETQPVDPNTKLWIHETGSQTVQVPTQAEFEIGMASKADKVSNAINGNLTALDSNGNLVDSGSKTSDFVTDVQVNGISMVSNGIANVPAALDGVTFTPSVSSEGVISWTNDGGRTNPQSVNIRGPKGDTGDTGPQGEPGDDYVLTGTDKNEIANRVVVPTALSTSVMRAGYAVAYETGSLGDSTYFSASNWVDISDWYAIRYKRSKTSSTNSNAGMAFYDSGKTYISGVRTVTGQDAVGYYGLYDVVVPDGAKYAMFSMLSDIETYGAFELYGFTSGGWMLEQKQDALTFDSAPISGSTNPVTSNGVYTALQAKANPVTVETVSGTDPVIAGSDNHRYVCGTVDTLTLTPPSSGIVDVVFTSGTTSTVLSVPNTIKWPEWFNPSMLDASTTYELNIMDGIYGAVMTWI